MDFELISSIILNTFLWLIVISSIFGNCLVCVAIITDKTLCRRSNSLYFSLAIADLIVSTCVMIFSLIYEARGQWDYGKVFCKIFLSLDVMCSTASIFHLVAIAIERYIHISRPFTYQKFDKPRNFVIMIILIWVIPFLLSFLPIFLDLHVPKGQSGNFTYGLEENQCLMELSLEYGFASSTISFFLPCIIMFGIYGKIFWFARNHSIKIKQLCSPLENTADDALRPNQHRKRSVVMNFFVNNFQYLKRVHNDNKAAITLGVILGVFIICWLPFFLINCINSACRCISEKVFKFTTWLGYCNSCLNPIIYTLFNPEFRLAFFKVLLAPVGCVSKEFKLSLLRRKGINDQSTNAGFSRSETVSSRQRNTHLLHNERLQSALKVDPSADDPRQIIIEED